MMRMILGIIHYVGGFFVILLGGPFFFSSLSRDGGGGDDDDDEWETYMSTLNGIFFFFQLYISCAANRFFFPSFPPKKLYV